MNRKLIRIPRDELQVGDTVWTITSSNACWWNEVATVEHHGGMSEVTFEPASRPAKVGYAVITPTPENFYGATVEVMRDDLLTSEERAA